MYRAPLFVRFTVLIHPSDFKTYKNIHISDHCCLKFDCFVCVTNLIGYSKFAPVPNTHTINVKMISL